METTFFLPAFGGTPYIATKVDANFYHLILLPSDWPLDAQLGEVFRQARANRLPTFLVWEPRSALAFEPRGRVEPARVVPRDGLVVVREKLAPGVEIPRSEELAARVRALDDYARSQHEGGCVTGDLRKGGRPAREAAELAGFSEAGVPRGLELCPTCLEWRGVCIDPNPLLRDLLVPVHCACQNIHRCARCAELLNDRRLCANYWNPRDEKIWYVPGFFGLRHACAGGVR